MELIETKHYTKKDDEEFILENINQLSHKESRRAYIFGGYVRDMLRNEPFQDMDVCAPDLETLKKFIKFLEHSGRLLTLQKKTIGHDTLGYCCYTLTVDTPKTQALKIDITYSSAIMTGEMSLANCDFTANNLIMYEDGTVGVRLENKNLPKAVWVSQCIRDCMEGKLVWMVPDKFFQHRNDQFMSNFMMRMNYRFEKMRAKGFVDTGKSLTSFKLIRLKDISTLPEEREAHNCVICREDYSDEPDKQTVVAKCNHHYHYECIQSWMERQTRKGEDRSCPNCRAKIVLYY